MPVRHTLRGFAMYAEFEHCNYRGDAPVTVTVQESSLATERKVWLGTEDRLHLNEEEARIIRDALTEFLGDSGDCPNLGQKESTMKTIEEVAAEVAADWHEEGKTRDADLRLAAEAIRAWEAQGPQDEEIYIVTDDTGEVLDVFATEDESKLFMGDRDDVNVWEETVWAPGEYAKHKANECDQCDDQAVNFWPNLKEPVQMCESCTHNARRSGWEPGQ